MSSVTLRVYDLSRGMAQQLSTSLLGVKIDGVWHTGILVFGREYFFGGGIQMVDPAEVVERYAMEPVRIFELGQTSVSEVEFHRYLQEIGPRYTAETYDLMTHNCNNFSDEIGRFLLNGVGIPQYILDLPNQVLATPFGAMLRPMLENMQSQMRLTGSEIPFVVPTSQEHSITNSIDDVKHAWECKVSYSGDPQLHLERILRRIEAVNDECRVLTVDELRILDALKDIRQPQIVVVSADSSSFPESISSRCWTVLLKLLKNLDSEFLFPALAVLRVMLLVPIEAIDEMTQCLELLFKIIDNSSNAGAELQLTTNAHQIAVFSVLTNAFINPSSVDIASNHCASFLPYVFRVLSTADTNMNVRVLCSKLIKNCCLALQMEEELIISSLICGCIEAIDFVSQGHNRNEGHASYETMLQSLMIGIMQLLSSFQLARNLSVQLGLHDILQRLRSTQKLEPLLREIQALVNK